MLNSRSGCGSGRSCVLSWDHCRCVVGFSSNKGRKERLQAKKSYTGAISSDMMQSYVANDLSREELVSILARPRIDFSSILDIVRDLSLSGRQSIGEFDNLSFLLKCRSLR